MPKHKEPLFQVVQAELNKNSNAFRFISVRKHVKIWSGHELNCTHMKLLKCLLVAENVYHIREVQMACDGFLWDSLIRSAYRCAQKQNIRKHVKWLKRLVHVNQLPVEWEMPWISKRKTQATKTAVKSNSFRTHSSQAYSWTAVFIQPWI